MKNRNHRTRGSVIALILTLAGALSGAAAGEPEISVSGNSQNFVPARYAIISTEIDVALQQGGMSNYRRCIVLKLDTQTGATSVLQLAQRGIGDPTVTHAVWAPVTEHGNFLNNMQINGL